MDVETVLERLAYERPLFHSEADFQHALAWEMHGQRPEYAIRLERRIPRVEDGPTVDIWAASRSVSIVLELKYKTRNLGHTDKRESFNLQFQRAQDVGRYDFLKDVKRLESVVSARPEVTGYAIFLTNDHLYWRPPRSETTVDRAFRIHQGREVNGTLAWSKRASKGTRRDREEPLRLRGVYRLDWREYSVVDSPRHGEFKYLLVRVAKNGL